MIALCPERLRRRGCQSRRGIVLIVCAVLLTACAARAPARPSGTGTPDSTAPDAFLRATRQCAGLKTITGELRLSGRAGTERIRGTLLAGLAAPASVRFEAVAPFGQPFFILAGRDNRAALLLPRDNRVLADAAVPEILERLIGLGLTASDLRLILTGCLTEQTSPTNGRAWPGGWQAVAGGDRVTAYMKNVNAAAVIVAADYGEWHVDYANHQNGWPRRVRIRSANRGGIDITAAIEQLEMNTGIDDKAFMIAAPTGAAPMSLDDLKSVAPLRGSE